MYQLKATANFLGCYVTCSNSKWATSIACLACFYNYTLFFFYKNKLYKNTQAEICPKIKNKLRTITRLKF